MASDLDELRLFIEDRIRAVDPSFDTSSGSSFDTELIAPIVARLGPDPFDTPLSDFFKARLATEFPELVVQDGDPIDDYGIRIMRILMEPFRRQIQKIGLGQSISDPRLLADIEANRLAANFFESRREGSFAVGTARLYFSAPQFSLVTPTNAVFTSANLRFLPVGNQSITAENMLFNTEGSLFFFDVVVRAETQGSESNIEANTLVGIENLPAVVQVKNPAKFDEGGDRETTEEFLARVEGSLTEKSLVTLRGIRTRLLDLFENVKSVQVIGYQDPEMKRDVLTGSEGVAYAYALCTALSSDSSISLSGTSIVDGNPLHDDFASAGVEVGDVIARLDLATQLITEFTVKEVITAVKLKVFPTPATLASATPHWIKSRSRGNIFLSNIPGGILVPQTPAGDIIVENNKVHIGGMLDIFIRAGFPQERSIDVPGLRDGVPLHFGVDLESFGGNADEFIQITSKITNQATTTSGWAGPGDGEILIKISDTGDGTVPWSPSAQDVGRFIQLLGTTDFRVYEIDAIREIVIQGGFVCRKILVSVFDQNTLANQAITNHAGAFDLSFRILEKITVKDRIRDRALPAADFNGNANGLGVSIGDSAVIETGDDAGIYSVRRILSHLAEDDTLIVDRNLTKTLTPTGAGDGSGLRYRITDSIQLDLVTPRAVKIPIGSIFLGDDLTVVAGSDTVFCGSDTNFLLAGVEKGDTLEILEGENAGRFVIDDVLSGSLVLATVPTNAGFQLDYTIYREFQGIDRPMVRVKAVELLDSSNLSTGVIVPYGDVIDARVVGTLGNRSQGNILESFQGSVPGAGTILNDLTTNFVAKGIVPGHRLEMLEGVNVGEYEVKAVLSTTQVQVYGAAEGGKDFSVADTELHYKIGQPSTGLARLYFLEPTSVDIGTGLLGGRLRFNDGATIQNFRFSEVSGRQLLPAPGSGDEEVRDLRVARSFDNGGGNFRSILEITDTENPDAYDLELEVGDVFDVHEPIPFKNSSGQELGTAAIPMFGTVAGLHTVAGSNRVSIPANSRVDFTQMGDLAGQLLYINAGPDQNKYSIDKVEGPVTLLLSATMTATTETITGRDITALDAEIQVVGADVYLKDVTDYSQLGAVNDYITIVEAKRPEYEGTFKVLSLDSVNSRVKIDAAALVPLGSLAPGNLTWFRTGPDSVNGTIQQPYLIYQRVAKEVQVVEVATKAPDVLPLGTANPGVTSLTTLAGGATEFSAVAQGDRLEILKGTNKGVYPIQIAAANQLTVYTAHSFSAVEPNVIYRVWAGLRGARRMVTVASFEGSDARVKPGSLIPYTIRRPRALRVSSTEMQANTEGGLYFIELQIESMAPGDDKNLSKGSPLEMRSGVEVDGYTYQVKNNVLTFSPYEEVSLTFRRRFLPAGNSDLPQNHTELTNRNIQIRYDTSQTVKLIDDLFHSDAERPMNANPIARHFLPSYVFTELRYKGGAAASVAGPDIETFINALGPFDELEVSDLEARLTRRGANSVRHPITLAAVTHDLDRKLTVRRSEDKITSDVVQFNGTARTTSFFAKFGEGLSVVRL
jgi:hypothetical protein